MIDTNLQAIVLAAGKALRFNTGRTKLLEKICGQEVLVYPLTLLNSMNLPITVVIGYEKERIQKILNDYNLTQPLLFVEQEEQRGAGHALTCTQTIWEKDNLLIVSGDMPLLTRHLIEKLYKKHIQSDAAISFITAHNPDPVLEGGYNRVIHKDNRIEIIHRSKASEDTHEQCCIDAGVYIIKKEALQKITRNRELFYYSDVLKYVYDAGYKVETITAPFDHIRGIKTLQDLWVTEQIKRADLIRYWMSEGVHFPFPQSVHLDLHVKIHTGSSIGSGVHLRGKTTIGKNCVIGEFSSLNDCTIADNVTIKSHCVIDHAHIQASTTIDPFSHIHSKNYKNFPQAIEYPQTYNESNTVSVTCATRTHLEKNTATTP